MGIRIRLMLAAVLAFAFVGAATTAVPEEEKPTAKEIGSNMKKYLGDELTFRDEIGYIYKRSKWEGFFRFDTQYVSCRIAEDKKEEIALIKEMVRKEIEPHWISLTGRVTSPNVLAGEFVFEVSSATRPIYPRDGLKKDEEPVGK